MYAAASVAERASLAAEHAEAAYHPRPALWTAAARGPLTEEAEAVHPGDAAQCDLWFPPRKILLEDGSRTLLPVLVITAAHSRYMVAG